MLRHAFLNPASGEQQVSAQVMTPGLQGRQTIGFGRRLRSIERAGRTGHIVDDAQ
jgi:hypothetical protein